jgi:hypothetical protein
MPHSKVKNKKPTYPQEKINFYSQEVIGHMNQKLQKNFCIKFEVSEDVLSKGQLVRTNRRVRFGFGGSTVLSTSIEIDSLDAVT